MTNTISDNTASPDTTNQMPDNTASQNTASQMPDNAANQTSDNAVRHNGLTRVIISGGGTGGHIFPAISIANALRRRFPAIDILFVGAENRMEMQRVPDAGYPIIGLPVAGFDRRRPWRNLTVLVKLYRSMAKARRIIRDFKPQIAVGVGGYASGPTLRAAQRAGIPTVIQEQNSYAGVTNKLLAARADRICVAYDGMERFFPSSSIVKTGNPVRKSLLDSDMTAAQAKTALGYDASRPLVLVVGGSLGARTINESVDNTFGALVGQGVQLLWQTGRNYTPSKLLPSDDVHIVPFITGMDVAYRAADLVVSRAGAGSISEIQLLGKAAVLVPSPNVAEDHQRKNALALADRHAAVMVADDRCRDTLAGEVSGLLADSKRLETLSRNVSAMALHDSDEKIVDAISELLSGSGHATDH